MKLLFLSISCLFFLNACGLGGTIKLNAEENQQVKQGKKSLLVTDNSTLSDYLFVFPAAWDSFLNRTIFMDLESIDGIALNLDYKNQANVQIVIEPGEHEISVLCRFEGQKNPYDEYDVIEDIIRRSIINYEFVGGKKYKIFDSGFVGRTSDPECALEIEEM